MRAVLAELAGTFALVLVGTGAVALGAPPAAVALAFGLVVAAAIAALGGVSGAHINPAVTLAVWLTGRLGGRAAAGYVVAQCAGAIAGSFAVLALAPRGPLGATVPAVPPGAALGLEALITFVLMTVILGVTERRRAPRLGVALAVGATVGLAAWIVGPLTGASMNPARSLGPAVASGDLVHLWLYAAAPSAGAVLAVIVCRVRRPGCCRGGPC